MDESSIILIDGWQIDASSCRIARNGDEKKLEPRSMELLLYLVDHPDQVVTREEIEANVWQGRVVGYDALSASLADFRWSGVNVASLPQARLGVRAAERSSDACSVEAYPRPSAHASAKLSRCSRLLVGDASPRAYRFIRVDRPAAR